MSVRRLIDRPDFNIVSQRLGRPEERESDGEQLFSGRRHAHLLIKLAVL